MVDKFTKSDLKNRMVVETRAGEKYILVDDRFLSKTGFLWLNTHTDKNRGTIHQGYNDDLTMDSGANWDIVKVYEEVNSLNINDDHPLYSLSLLWERNSIKEVTMAEVEAKFGCKVKIVNGDK